MDGAGVFGEFAKSDVVACETRVGFEGEEGGVVMDHEDVTLEGDWLDACSLGYRKSRKSRTMVWRWFCYNTQ